jgi:hypothetical protein
MRHLRLAGDIHDLQRIIAVMVFPEDGFFRNSYFRLLLERGTMPDDPSIPSFAPGELPRWAEIRDRVDKSAQTGWLAMC